MPSSASRASVATMCERPPSPLTPSVMTGGCCSRSSRSGIWSARRSSTSARCSASASPYGTTPRRRTSSWRTLNLVDVELFELILDVRHELVGDGAVDEAVVVAERQVGHRPDRDRIVDDDRTLLDRADAED